MVLFGAPTSIAIQREYDLDYGSDEGPLPLAVTSQRPMVNHKASSMVVCPRPNKISSRVTREDICLRFRRFFLPQSIYPKMEGKDIDQSNLWGKVTDIFSTGSTKAVPRSIPMPNVKCQMPNAKCPSSDVCCKINTQHNRRTLKRSKLPCGTPQSFAGTRLLSFRQWRSLPQCSCRCRSRPRRMELCGWPKTCRDRAEAVCTLHRSGTIALPVDQKVREGVQNGTSKYAHSFLTNE